MRTSRITLLAGVLMSLTAVRASAQLNSVPIVFSPAIDYQRWNVAAYFGHGNEDAGGSSSFGVRGGVSPLAWVNLDVGAGTLNPADDLGERSTQFQWMANLSAGPTLGSDTGTQFSIAAVLGVGRASLGEDASTLDVPLGAGFAAAFLWPGVEAVLWTVPHYSLRRRSAAGESAWQNGPGISLGTTIIPEILTFVRLQGGIQWVHRSAETAGMLTLKEATEFTWMVGLQTRFPINPD